MQPITSETQFKQVVPRTRKERRDRESKETLEKSRLMNRRECHFKYTNLGKLTEPKEGTLQHCNDSERFQTDCAGDYKIMRDQGLQQRKMHMDEKRAAMIDREEVRWNEIDTTQSTEQQKWEQIRELGERNRRNTSSVPYDPITLGYHDNKDGDHLRHSDDMVRYRSAMRAQQLRSRNTCGFDPITGVPGKHLKKPEKPSFVDRHVQ
jgi:hypothetical protein